ncbi:flagellar filament capping protein FliD [Planctomicrobium sp. SH661]|uniref:flagellar filament capping protein FliD n=1 Tax=Planctomicrobium sp. SH661 TaxID=3448124 RepID=UPI003F5C9E98
MASVNVGGLISGIDTDNIIAGLLNIQQKQLDQFNVKRTDVQTRQTAYQSLQTQLVSFRTTALSLASSVSNPFDSRLVTVSKPEALVATASAKATSGTYQLKINSLASAHQVASQEFADADSAITQGTFSLRVGSQTQADITIDSTNNTLSGLADAINFSNVGITASVVQDANSSFRLLLTSSKTGTSNEISVVNQLADSADGAVKPVIDFDNPVQATSDASVTLGSGPGALTVTSESNSVSTLISGVTLNLLDADPVKTVNVTISADTEKATKAVKEFVSGYNSILDFIDSQTKYDSEKDAAAILQGDYSAINIRNQLQNVLQSVIPGSSTKANRLSSLGIITSDTGRLTVNETQLQNVVSGSVSGVTNSDLRHLFAIDGKGTNGNVSFLFASAKTRESATPYQVKVTTAAERATITGGTALAASTVIDNSNNTLLLNLDGVETSVTLAHGTYTRDELADHVEAVINGNSAFVGRTVSVGVTGSNQLNITSDSYGTSSRITVFASSATSALGYNGGESDIGVNVAGHFIVNGKVEAANGTGRTLTGAEGNANTDGLQVRVTLSPGQIMTEPEGSITVTRGVASRLNALIDGLIDSKNGMLTSLNNTYSDQLASIQKSIDNQQKIFDKQKDQLTSRFAAMERALQQLKTTSSLLGSQLASISGMASSS